MTRVTLDQAAYIVQVDTGFAYDTALLLLIDAVTHRRLPADIKPRLHPFTDEIIDAVASNETTVAPADVAEWLQDIPIVSSSDKASPQYLEGERHWIDRNEVIARFNIHTDGEENFKFWNDKLSRPPKWLQAAQMQTGRPGASSRWNPKLIAHCLLEKTTGKSMDMRHLDQLMHKWFPELEDQWKEETQDRR